ncbi:IPT/TIG domain-containing protein [Chitinimonas sp. BJB300]|uniref:IPT/TIG domain-containing protein n=1 Tax=Chitinimonas sp. BJB300 TaxID=1559339 RepID=UPI000C112BEF|nr:IPT/TIG domain-containing protein [Chitinimonas sp. BJB300]PHV10857.1 hypothetical protein CSQ89_14045 [Chitinimonas sp. BJB300]TSJ83776.1 hypothetical protein FG002_020985 [Chitinimonas sp. BJB300]
MYSLLQARNPLLICLLLSLTACGGGGGGNDSSTSTTPPTTTNPTPTTPTPTTPIPTTPAPPASILTIHSIKPLDVEVGGKLTIEGVEMQTVNHILVGGAEVKFSLVSNTQLTVEIPAGAKSGPVQLHATGAVIQSDQTVTILGAPIVTKIDPLTAKVGHIVTISGSNLDTVKDVLLNGQAVTVLKKNADSLVFQITDKDRSGTLSLSYGTNSIFTIATPLTVDIAPTVTSFNPTAGFVGSIVDIEGNNLDEIAEVAFSPVGSATTVKPTAISATRLTVTVPVGATTGVVELTHANGQKHKTSVNFTIAPEVVVKDIQPRSGKAGDLITVTGSNLKEVTGVTVNKVPVTILLQDNDSIRFVLPVGGGEVVLHSKYQPNVKVGVLTDTTVPTPGKPTVSITRVEVAQTYLQAPGDRYQRLVPGKAALLRVYVAGKEGMASPAVQVIASAGSTVLGTVQLTGPTKLSAVPQASALDQTFNVKLPASWIRENLNLQVEVDPTKQTTNGASLNTRPVVGKPTNLRLLLVPFTIREGNQTAQMHDLAAVRTLLGKQLPIAETNIFVEQRAPYFLTTVDYVRNDKIIEDGKEVLSSKKWGDALAELNQLRNTEANQKHYYGLVPDPNFNGGTAGLGYVPQGNGDGSGRSSIGLDARKDPDLSTMVHELGHNFGRPHAPCGGAGDPDRNFPYSDGSLGTTAIYDNVADSIIPPTDKKDVMSYCSGNWFSDYSYSKIQERLESWQYPVTAPVRGFSNPVELLEISGQIDANGATLQPVGGSTGSPEQYTGSYQLKVYLKDGSQLLTNFNPIEVADAGDSLSHFNLKLAKPASDVVSIEVLKAGKVLTPTKPRTAAQVVGNKVGLKLTWHENGGKLQLKWDDSRFRYLTLVHQGSEKTLLGIQLQGGQADVDVSRLSSGGEWLITLSDGLNPRQIKAKR